MNRIKLGLDFSLAQRVLRVSLPLMGSMVGNLVMMLVDRICLARYSNDTLAASGPAIFTSMAIVGFFAAASGFSRSCVAQGFGRSGRDEAMYQAAVGILIGFVLAVVLVSLAPLIAQIPFLSHRPPAVTRLESQFLYWSAYFGGVMTFNMSLSSYFNGIGHTRVTLAAGLVGQAVDIVMTIGLVFGKFGLPELGMRGSALGTLAGTLAILCCYLACMPHQVWRRLRGLRSKGRGFLTIEVWPRLRKGLTLGISTGADNFGNTTFIWIIAGLGTIALAANNINLTMNYVGIIPLIGLGIGCSVLCGNAIGVGDYALIPRIIAATLAIELIYVGAISALELTLPHVLLDPFGLAGKPEEIRRASVATLQVLWVFSLAFTFAMTGAAVLEAFGLARFIFVTRVAFMWLLSIPTVAVVATRHAGNADFLPLCWIIGALFEGVIGACYFLRIAAAIRKRQNDIVLAHAGG